MDLSALEINGEVSKTNSTISEYYGYTFVS